jgi:putative flippase GtrA
LNSEVNKKKTFWGTVKSLLLLKTKFALSSLVATLVDYSIYLFLVYTVFSPTISNIISASCGMVINFLLQKKYVFELKRKVLTAFQLSVLVSVGGIAISTFIVTFLSDINFFNTHQYITKLLATGIVFFYNFYLKRFVFEKRLI